MHRCPASPASGPTPSPTATSSSPSHPSPERKDSLGILDNLFPAQLAVSVDAVDKRDGDLGDRVAHGLGRDGKGHLHAEAAHVGGLKQLLEHIALVQAERARQVADARPQQGVGQDVGALGRHAPLEVPAVHAASWGVPCARDDVVVGRFLPLDHLRYELGVVGEVGCEKGKSKPRDPRNAHLITIVLVSIITLGQALVPSMIIM